MKTHIVGKYWLLALTLLLAACGSTPSHNYYLLTAREAPGPTGTAPSVGIGPVRIPEYLNRNNLVYQQDGNRLQIADYERWAEPLEEGILRVLGLNLAALLDTQDIRQFPWHPDRAPQFGVTLRLLSLDADQRGAKLEAEWLLHRPATGEGLQRRLSRFSHTETTGELTPDRLATVYSDLLYRLSEEIAGAVRAASSP
jgi:uncharacterized lipoprotein YmbA